MQPSTPARSRIATRNHSSIGRTATELQYGAGGVCDDEGKPVTQKVVQVMMRRVARRAKVKPGLHTLRHTFCSHLAMRGAPARAIQKLAGHQNLGTRQRYKHVSAAALDAAIRLLDGADSRGGIVEAAGKLG